MRPYFETLGEMLDRECHIAAVFLTDPSASPPPPQLTTLELPGVEGRSNLWPKVKAGLVAAWERYQDR